MSEKLEEPIRKKYVFFGVDLEKVECLRNSLLSGYPGAIVGGLATFFYTSKPVIATHAAFASYWICATCSWVHCRYHRYQRMKEMSELKQLMKVREMKENEYNLPPHLELEAKRSEFLSQKNSMEKNENSDPQQR